VDFAANNPSALRVPALECPARLGSDDMPVGKFSDAEKTAIMAEAHGHVQRWRAERQTWAGSPP